MSWFSRSKAPKPSADVTEKLQIPDDVWTQCLSCAAVLYTKELRRNFGVCPKCNYHFRLKVKDRLPLLVDRHSFLEIDPDLRSSDPLNFKDSRRYKERLRKAEKDSGSTEAVVTGEARLLNIPVMVGRFASSFIGGSMGAVVGEKLARMFEAACLKRIPAIVLSASGGARMMEGIFSLMQMAKVSAAIGRMNEKKVPYISVLTDPTTGGVAASLAMLGDIIIAEPKALIGFAGPRVIEQTIKRKLPEGFQRAEFLLEHGMIDCIMPRSEMREGLARVIRNLGFEK